MSEHDSKSVLKGISALLGERWRELLLLGTLLGSLFSMVALIGYAPEDPTWLRPNTGRVTNPCGPLGALIADVLFQNLGWGAWAAFGTMVASVLTLAGRSVLRPFLLANLGVLYVAGLGAIHLALGGEGPYPRGGQLGQTLAEALVAVVGTVGAALVLAGTVLGAVTLLGNIRWGRVARWMVDFAEARWPAVRDLLHAGAVRTGETTKAGASASWSTLRAAAGGGATSTRTLLQRVMASFRGEESDAGLEEAEVGLEAIDADPDLFVPSDSIATAHSMPVVAEVQWEPTVAGPSSGIRDMFTDVAPRNVQDRTSSVGSVFTGIASSAVPEPLSERTQPGQITDDSTPWESIPDEPRDTALSAGPLTNGVTLTPPPVERDEEPPAPRVRKGEVAVAVAEALSRKVSSDDGGEVRKSRKGFKDFRLPKLSLLDIVPEQKAHFDGEKLRELAQTVEATLASFKVTGEVVNIRVGPVVTIFEFLPESGIKVSRIAGLSDDLAMSLCATSVRIVAPIPGKGVVGIEIPSPKRLDIYFRELLASDEFRNTKDLLPVALGKDVEGNAVFGNLQKMPHVLVAGTTGAGKSVGVNGMLLSLLYTLSPEDLRLLLIDPKQLEFKMYDDVPHLLHPVVTDPKKAAAALDWCVREMEDRYARLAAWNVRNIVPYNEKVEREAKNWSPEKARKYVPKGWTEGDPLPEPEKMPFIVIVIDELADLMMVAKKEIETSIARIAQKARACGIHLVLATQRPSADVVTGLIKSNMPTRIAFKLKSGLDSRVILDENGAERLLGRGDMLYSPNGGSGGIERVHGAFVSDEEVERVCDYLREQAAPQYIDAVTAEPGVEEEISDEERDPLFAEAAEVVIGAGKASTSMVQRHLKIGYNRAARIIDQLEMAGIVGPADGARPRDVLVSSI
ncbi:MAG: DNA translocase FtsK [Alphaproteobacteria bacterium]|nr:DNA translocase FtsK [Alphaproteobacteria bacterium]